MLALAPGSPDAPTLVYPTCQYHVYQRRLERHGDYD